MQNIFTIITTVSGVLISLAAILTTFRKVRSWLVNKFVTDIKFDQIDKRSEMYNMHEKILDSEKQRGEIIHKIDSLARENRQQMNDIRMSTLRLELGRLIDHEPKNLDTIFRLYDEYVAMGGNSYMVERIEKWKEEYCG